VKKAVPEAVVNSVKAAEKAEKENKINEKTKDEGKR
jgi:hypothetical protein